MNEKCSLSERRRRSKSSWLKTGIILFMIVYLLSQLIFKNFLNLSESKQEFNYSNADILDMLPLGVHKFLTAKLKNISHINGSNESSYNANGQYFKPPLNISEIKKHIAQYNLQQTIYNEDIFGPLQNDSVVVVVQAHRRITYLRYLIVSLAQARDISQVLLIVSHDYYDEDINSLIQSVDFCKVIQIFYPYSIQTHPKEFPGQDSNDCPRNIEREQALIQKCNNALFPDLYGRYREAKFTQIKHHWWWKAYRIFNQLDVTRDHSGLFLFLEEDHYVAEDFIHVLKLMERTSSKECKHCNILSLGNYMNAYKSSYYGDTQMVKIIPWVSTVAMAFNKSIWMKILNCAEFFCKYDDYNWDWTLQHVSQNCLKQELYSMVVHGSRVLHLGQGECGLHQKRTNCESRSTLMKILQVLKSAERHLYPNYLKLTYYNNLFNENINLKKRYGGWGDRRDHVLCMTMTLT